MQPAYGPQVRVDFLAVALAQGLKGPQSMAGLLAGCHPGH